MPKAPILSRTSFFAQLGDKTIRLLEWNAVETELGTMVEPRQTPHFGVNPVTNIDAFDASITKLQQINPDTFYTQYGTAGDQAPMDYSPQGV